jgi:hypothetical protein
MDSNVQLEDLRQTQVEYSDEKNESVKTMLSLYSFLNIVAIGAIVYIARITYTPTTTLKRPESRSWWS